MRKCSNYEKPTASIVLLDTLDVLTTSGGVIGANGDDFLKDPWAPGV